MVLCHKSEDYGHSVDRRVDLFSSTFIEVSKAGNFPCRKRWALSTAFFWLRATASLEVEFGSDATSRSEEDNISISLMFDVFVSAGETGEVADASNLRN